MQTKYILQILIIINLFSSYLFSEIIPSNNLKNYTLNKWIIVKDDDINENKINDLLNDPVSFIEKSPEVNSIDLGNQRDVTIRLISCLITLLLILKS